jgi:hypothetical protein
MINWCFEELKAKAHTFTHDPFGIATVYNGEVVKSDLAASEATRTGLNDAVKVLESVPNKDKDWQPESYYKVINLVDPNLYPLVFGKTKVLDIGDKEFSLQNCVSESGRGSVIPVPDEYGMLDRDHPWSLDSQWLPCEVDIGYGKARSVQYLSFKVSVLMNAIESCRTSTIYTLTTTPTFTSTSKR